MEEIHDIGYPPAEDWIAHHARFAPSSEAAHDLASGRRFTYAEMDERVSRAALWLRDAFAVQPGDRVAVLPHERQCLRAAVRLPAAGAIFPPLNWRLAVPELEFICKDATPVVLVHGDEFADAALQVAKLASVPHTANCQRQAQCLRGGSRGARGTLCPADARSRRHLDRYVHVRHHRPAQGRARITYQMCVFNSVHCAMTVGLTAAHQESGVPADLPHWRPQRLCQSDLPYRRLQRGVAGASSPALSCPADRSRSRYHRLAGRADQFPDAGPGRASPPPTSHIRSMGVAAPPSPLSLIETFGRKGIALRQGWGMTETGPMGPSCRRQGDGEIGSPVCRRLYVRLKICDPTAIR